MNEFTNTRKSQGAGMTSEQGKHFGRRDFLRRGAVVTAAAGAGTVAGGTLLATSASSTPGVGMAQLPLSESIDYQTIPSVRLMATDGHFSLPGRRHRDEVPVFGLGFRVVDDLRTVDLGGELNKNPGELISKYKGLVTHTAPTTIGIEGIEMAIVLTNLGLVVRPDLDDSHSLHWHGFRNATAVFDGVPETSIAVPSGRDLPYFYDPKLGSEPGQSKGSAGTYMYHCHFEDTEHVQMGMTGIILVEPWQAHFSAEPISNDPNDWLWLPERVKVAYNSNAAGVDSSFDREFGLLINEIDTAPHDNLENVQEFVWSDYKPNYWTINGRSYPDTVIPQISPIMQVDTYDPGTGLANGINFSETVDMPVTPISAEEIAEAEMYWQPNSALIQCRAGDRVLLRIASLGFEIHSLEAPGLDLDVIAHDASLLVGKNGTSDLSYTTRRIEVGPGEARDVLFTAPAYDDGAAEIDVLAPRTTGYARKFNRYLIKSRNNDRNHNDGGASHADGPSYADVNTANNYGGMVTEIWVYPTWDDAVGLGQTPLPEQISINETFPTLVMPDGQV